jgi:hypothetical protein
VFLDAGCRSADRCAAFRFRRLVLEPLEDRCLLADCGCPFLAGWDAFGPAGDPLTDKPTSEPLGASGAQIEMTLVRQPTPLQNQDTGEIDVLPASQPWIHEWEPFWVEVWVRATDAASAAVSGGTVDLGYHANLTTAVEIQYGPAFTEGQSGTINDAAGWVDDIGGVTTRTDVGEDHFALLARIRFEAIRAK